MGTTLRTVCAHGKAPFQLPCDQQIGEKQVRERNPTFPGLREVRMNRSGEMGKIFGKGKGKSSATGQTWQ